MRSSLVFRTKGVLTEAALDAGATYFDIASEQEHYRRLRTLGMGPGRDRGLILTGVGAYPGLSGILLNALLSRFPEAESAEMALISGAHADPSAGGAQAVSGVVELAFELSNLRDAQLHRLRPGRRRRFKFSAPFGARDVLTWPQLEVLAAAERGGLRGLSTFVALGGERLPSSLLLQAVALLRPIPGSLSLSLVKRVLAARSARTFTTPDDPTVNKGALVVSVRCAEETYTATALVHDLPAATAWLPVYAATLWGCWDTSTPGSPRPNGRVRSRRGPRGASRAARVGYLPALGHMSGTRNNSLPLRSLRSGTPSTA